MYPTLLLIHSWSRWLVLIFGLIAIFRAFSGWQNRRPYLGADNGMAASFVGSMHLQLLLGLILYFISPVGAKAFETAGSAVMKDAGSRFFAVEHLVGMLLAVVVAQVGRIVSKKAVDPVVKHRKAFIWFTVALVIVLLMIPWGIWNPARPMFRF
ncbi:hypothetical protein [Hymenobacter actinosclerus]|uniref:Cytochrome b561 n=1 Tax=Hymenobacter actinosclerus TaxID=82805 RepID=A0A1I0F987_9BACT|nr:hypothetical protein [Hymenobacter actinosclerus]SET54668.1 hypothetical protein SAMN04487998_2174 [Hymenobacter actinosclerus]